MDITDVRVRKISDDGKMKAVVSVTFDDEFVVHDIKIIEGQNGLFIAMPSRKMGEGDFRDIAHPLVSETRNRIKDAIFAEYEKILEEQAAEKAAAADEPEAVSETVVVEETDTTDSDEKADDTADTDEPTEENEDSPEEE